jgi:glutamyl-tRNA reductase
MTKRIAEGAGRRGQGTQVLVLGVNYRRAPLELRERLAFPGSALKRSLAALRTYVPEGAILSTCHRVEIYAAALDPSKAVADLKVFLAKERAVRVAAFEPYLYTLVGREAVEHVFAVASGTDSAIIGEAQILGQVRETLRTGLECHSMGRVLSELFRRAMTAGRRARAETSIGRRAVSISYAAVELAKRQCGDLSSSKVLLVGTGEMGRLAAKNLLDKGAAAITLTGRTQERVKTLAVECGDLATVSSLEEALRDCDIVISCTSAPHHVIASQMVRKAMGERRGRSLLLIDIAVPRDIDPAVSRIPGVRLFNIDDLQCAVEENINQRRVEARKVVPIITDAADGFECWLATQRAVPTIIALKRWAEAVRQEELARTSSVLKSLPEHDRRRIEALTLAMQKKLLHQTIALLREGAANGDGRATDEAVRGLFGLGPAMGCERDSHAARPSSAQARDS